MTNLGILDDMDHETKIDTDAEHRKSELRIQALGAAISRRDWHAIEEAYGAIRDKFYSNSNADLLTPFAWAIVLKWLDAYDEEEATFSRYRDSVILDGIMTAAQRRAMSAIFPKNSRLER